MVVDADVSVNYETTTAESVYDLAGRGGQKGIEIVALLEGGIMVGNDYTGTYSGFTFGDSIPFVVSGYITDTRNVNVWNVADTIRDVWRRIGCLF